MQRNARDAINCESSVSRAKVAFGSCPCAAGHHSGLHLLAGLAALSVAPCHAQVCPGVWFSLFLFDSRGHTHMMNPRTMTGAGGCKEAFTNVQEQCAAIAAHAHLHGLLVQSVAVCHVPQVKAACGDRGSQATLLQVTPVTQGMCLVAGVREPVCMFCTDSAPSCTLHCMYTSWSWHTGGGAPCRLHCYAAMPPIKRP